MAFFGAGITKTIVHPRAVDNSRIVRMDVFYSMWRNRTIPCPEGSGRPACETILLHREDFKISEALARFAVRHGMGGFVKGLTGGARKFIDERRTRVDMVRRAPPFSCRDRFQSGKGGALGHQFAETILWRALYCPV